MWAPTQEWFAAAPQTVRVIKRKLNPAVKFITPCRGVAQQRRHPRRSRAAGRSARSRQGKRARAAHRRHARSHGEPVTFVIVTSFLLAGGPPMLARMTAAFVDDLNAGHVLDIIEKVRREVGRFYVTTTIINLGLGCATAGAMMLCGMPTPYLWGIIAAGLNFIPYAGSTLTLIIVTLVAFVTFDGIGARPGRGGIVSAAGHGGGDRSFSRCSSAGASRSIPC